MEGAIPWIMLAATIAAAAAAGFTWSGAKAVRKSTTSSNLINCLNSYITIMKARTQAIDSKNEQRCKDFYRELFDLHWTEFQMWRAGLIPDHVMKAWLDVRRRNYKEDSIRFEKDGREVTVSYREVWDELKRKNYFEPEDLYRRFMNQIHEEVITDMKKLRKDYIIK